MSYLFASVLQHTMRGKGSIHNPPWPSVLIRLNFGLSYYVFVLFHYSLYIVVQLKMALWLRHDGDREFAFSAVCLRIYASYYVYHWSTGNCQLSISLLRYALPKIFRVIFLTQCQWQYLAEMGLEGKSPGVGGALLFLPYQSMLDEESEVTNSNTLFGTILQRKGIKVFCKVERTSFFSNKSF